MRQLSGYRFGEEVCVPILGDAVRERLYQDASIGVVLSGSFDYRTQGGAALAVPGTVLFGNSGEYFSCGHADSAGNRRQVVHFGGDFLREVADTHGISQVRFPAVAVPPGRWSAAIFGRMRRLALQTEAQDETAYDLAVTALQTTGSRGPTAAVSSRNQRRVLGVVRHLESSYDGPCSLQSLAALAQLSPCYFLRLFRQVTGQSPAQYVMNARLRAAANALLTTRAPVTEIALKTGFNDISHFNASFRSVFGRSPTRWRGSPGGEPSGEPSGKPSGKPSGEPSGKP
jgi:AraC family transcriptional regulator